MSSFEPGEQRQAVVQLVNRGWRPIHLAPPAADCGCIVTTTRPVTVPARGEIAVRLRLVAPTGLGVTTRTLTLQNASDPSMEWKVPLTVNVDADVWVEARTVVEYELPYRPSEVVAATAYIRHKTHVALGEIVSSDPGLAITLAGDSGEMLRVSCRPTDPSRPVGEAMLRVYKANGEKVAIEVPVCWRPVPRLRLVPMTVLVDPTTPPQGRLDRRVDLYFRNGTPEYTVASRVPWVTARVERADGRSSVWIAFERAAMPDLFDGPLAVVSVAGDPSEYMIGGQVGLSP